MNIEKQIEFDKIKEIWSGLAVTDKAKERIKDTTVYLYENELRKHLRDTTEARFFIEKMGTPPLQNISEMQDILQISEKGDCLTPYQLERVETVLVAIRRLKEYLSKGKTYNNSLAYYDENLDFVSDLYEEIRSKIRNGAVECMMVKELVSGALDHISGIVEYSDYQCLT